MRDSAELDTVFRRLPQLSDAVGPIRRELLRRLVVVWVRGRVGVFAENSAALLADLSRGDAKFTRIPQKSLSAHDKHPDVWRALATVGVDDTASPRRVYPEHRAGDFPRLPGDGHDGEAEGVEDSVEVGGSGDAGGGSEEGEVEGDELMVLSLADGDGGLDGVEDSLAGVRADTSHMSLAELVRAVVSRRMDHLGSDEGDEDPDDELTATEGPAPSTPPPATIEQEDSQPTTTMSQASSPSKTYLKVLARASARLIQ